MTTQTDMKMVLANVAETIFINPAYEINYRLRHCDYMMSCHKSLANRSEAEERGYHLSEFYKYKGIANHLKMRMVRNQDLNLGVAKLRAAQFVKNKLKSYDETEK